MMESAATNTITITASTSATEMATVINSSISEEKGLGSGSRKSVSGRYQRFVNALLRRQSGFPVLTEHERHKKHNQVSGHCQESSQPLFDRLHQNHPNCDKSDYERLNTVLEMYLSEREHVNDLRTIIKSFVEPIRVLRILDPTESHQIFYTIEDLVPIFDRLACTLSEAIHASASFSVFVRVLADWVGVGDNNQSNVVPTPVSDIAVGALLPRSTGSVTLISAMDVLVDYTSHLYEARECMEATKSHKQEFSDFLSRCYTTTFSKRLDLWHFLDSPRTRLLRYPLLINRLIKLTPANVPETGILLKICKAVSHITREMDRRAGEAMCRFHLRRIQLSASLLHSEIIKRQKVLLLSGTLETKRGPVKAFVFTEVMLLALTCSRAVSVPYPSSETRSNNSDSNTNLEDAFAADCAVSSASRRWSMLTRRLSSRYGSQSTSPTSAQQRASVSSPIKPEPVLMTQTRQNSYHFNSISDLVPYLERYRVYKQPILLQDCVLENLTDGRVRFPSLRRTLLLENTGMNMFRIYQHSAVPIRSRPWMTVRRHTDPVTSESMTGRNPLLSSCRLRSRLSGPVTRNPTIHSDNGTLKKCVVLLQALSAEDKTLWISTLSPLVAKVVSGDA